MVEPQDFDVYKKKFKNVINIKKNNKGVHYCRNYVLEWAKKNNYDKFWLIDDNIDSMFYRPMDKIKGFRIREKINNPTKVFNYIEEIADRCVNFGAGCLTHDGFAFSKKNDIDINKMVYCFQLINSNIKSRFQPRTAEDIDFSVRILREGWVTMCFNMYSFKKPKSGSMEGGCNSIDYKNDGRKKRFLTLANDYPQWFTEYEKNGKSEIKPSKIWLSFKQMPMQKK
jgi:hypothetical protein